MRYNIQNDVVVIPKSVHEDRIKENISVFDFSLTEEEMNSLKFLDKASPMILSAIEKSTNPIDIV